MFIIIISGITGKKGVLRGQKILFFCPFHPLNRLISRSKKKYFGNLEEFRAFWRNDDKIDALACNMKKEKKFIPLTTICWPKNLKPKKMKKIRISFSRFTDVNFRKNGEHVYDSLINNTAFVTLATLLVVVKTALDKYTADLAAAATNDKNAVAQKNQSRFELTALLQQLGLAVMAEANGNEAMLISSGFTLVKTREVRYIANPGNVTVSQGITSGQMISMVKGQKAATSYVHQLTTELPDDNTAWISKNTSSSKFAWDGLVPGKQYWVRVAVIGSRKQIAYSTVAVWFAQ